MVNKEQDRPYRVGEVARLAGLANCTVWHHIKQGRLPAFRWADRCWYMVKREDAHKWIEERKAARKAGDKRYKANRGK